MVASRTASRPMSFIGTLSQTLTLRAAFASSTYLLSQIPGPGRSSDDDLLIPLIPFSRGHIRPSCAPERMATASLLFGRHLMMPCCSFWTMSGQPHCPRQIARLPRIIRHTQSSSTSHVSKGCTRMSLTAATRLSPWRLAYLNPPNHLFKGAHQGLRSFHRRMAALPADSGPASEDALFGTRGRHLRSRRAWSSLWLLVAGA